MVRGLEPRAARQHPGSFYASIRAAIVLVYLRAPFLIGGFSVAKRLALRLLCSRRYRMA